MWQQSTHPSEPAKSVLNSTRYLHTHATVGVLYISLNICPEEVQQKPEG